MSRVYRHQHQFIGGNKLTPLSTFFYFLLVRTCCICSLNESLHFPSLTVTAFDKIFNIASGDCDSKLF